MSFNKDISNKIVFPAGSSANVRRFPSTATTVQNTPNVLFTAKAGEVIGRTSGTFFLMKDGKWYQVNLNKEYAGRSYGYVREDIIKLQTPVSDAVAEENYKKLMNAIQASDIQVNKNLIKAGALLIAAKNQKKDISALAVTFESIRNRYNTRQNEIQTSSLVKVTQWNEKAYNTLSKAIDSSAEVFALGSIGVAPVIIYAAVFVSGLAAAGILYYWLRPKYSESVVDLQSSAELVKALSALTPDEATTLKNNLESQIDNAYNQGKRDQWFTGLGGNLKTGLILVGAFLGVKLILDTFQPRNTTKA